MKYTIYKITNQINGKIYIGKHQTNNLDDGYMGSGKYLKYAQQKYGLENFIKEILHIFDSEEEMNAKEKELVTEDFCLREDTYNICVGGLGGWGYINNNKLNGTNEGRIRGGLSQKDRVVEQFKRQCANKEWHEKRINKSIERHGPDVFKSFKNRKHTEESRMKISYSNKNQLKLKCPYCDVIGISSNMSRWHFDKCKRNSF